MRGEGGASGPENGPVRRLLDLAIGEQQVFEIRGRGHDQGAAVQVEANLAPGEAGGKGNGRVMQGSAIPMRLQRGLRSSGRTSRRSKQAAIVESPRFWYNSARGS